MRQAESGAFLSLDQAGTVTIANGEKSAIQLSADALTIQSGNGSALMQLDLSGSRATLQMGAAVLTLAGSGAVPPTSSLVTPSVLQLAAAGAPPAEHVMTTEACVNLVSGIFNALGALLNALPPAPLTTNALGALLIDPAFSTALAAAIPTIIAVRTQNPLVAAALVGVFSNPSAKPAAVPGQGQLQPGIGCTGLLAG
jgi:hypothetical protein